MKKYILSLLLIVILVIILNYFYKDIEGFDPSRFKNEVCNRDDPTKKGFVNVITGDELTEIQEKCDSTPPRGKCLKRCNYKNVNPTKQEDPMEIYGGCGEQLFSLGGENFKKCPPRCLSNPAEQEEEHLRRNNGMDPSKCLFDSECDSCVSKIIYDRFEGKTDAQRASLDLLRGQKRFLDIICGKDTKCPDSTKGDCCGWYEDNPDGTIDFESPNWQTGDLPNTRYVQQQQVLVMNYQIEIRLMRQYEMVLVVVQEQSKIKI